MEMADLLKKNAADGGGILFLDLLKKIDMGPANPPAEVEDPPEDRPSKTVERRPVGDGEYLVQQGECISSIAYSKGHFWETIWNDPANATLKRVRKDQHVILPDDRVHIPPIRIKWEDGQTEHRHRFRRRGIPERFHIQLLDFDEQPLPNLEYRLVINNKSRNGFTNGKGEIIVSIPPDAKEGTLIIDSIQTTIQLSFGALDPVIELSGIQARLNNLGYKPGAEDGKWSQSTDSAIRHFQDRQGLKVTGEIDDNTLSKLKEVYKDEE